MYVVYCLILYVFNVTIRYKTISKDDNLPTITHCIIKQKLDNIRITTYNNYELKKNREYTLATQPCRTQPKYC